MFCFLRLLANNQIEYGCFKLLVFKMEDVGLEMCWVGDVLGWSVLDWRCVGLEMCWVGDVLGQFLCVKTCYGKLYVYY